MNPGTHEYGLSAANMKGNMVGLASKFVIIFISYHHYQSPPGTDVNHMWKCAQVGQRQAGHNCSFSLDFKHVLFVDFVILLVLTEEPGGGLFGQTAGQIWISGLITEITNTIFSHQVTQLFLSSVFLGMTPSLRETTASPAVDAFVVMHKKNTCDMSTNVYIHTSTFL